jgi:hypothetical protein
MKLEPITSCEFCQRSKTLTKEMHKFKKTDTNMNTQLEIQRSLYVRDAQLMAHGLHVAPIKY